VRTQDLTEQHAREDDVVRELRLPDTLRTRVNFPEGFSYYFEIFSHGFYG